MRRVFFLILLLSTVVAHAGDVTVGWDPNPPSENVTGYLIFLGDTSLKSPGFQNYRLGIDVGNVTQYSVNICEQAPATTYLAAKAYRDEIPPAEPPRSVSDYSEEIYTNKDPPAKPTGFRIGN